MIARKWCAAASKADAELYVRHFERKVAPALKALPGHHGAWLLRRDRHGGVEFVALTLWSSRDSIKAFAGDDIGKAHVEPEARAVLTKFDDTAEHYEVAVAALWMS
jgi:heme-degrading monooxygenase HmoA